MFSGYNEKNKMNISEIIKDKLAGKELTLQQIQYVVKNYSDDVITEEQMGDLVKAFKKEGMNMEETMNFFDCTYKLARKINLDSISGFKLDKHSTGGIGDKVSMILLPILEATGLKIYKLSGGRLGFTGGTLEKLSTFPGMKIKFSYKELLKKIHEENLVIAGVSNSLSKFEEKLYVLRSKLGIIDILGMIVNSIMIKKIIVGNNGLALEVTVGTGAVFPTMKRGEEFAKIALEIAKKYNRKAVAVLTAMNQPLGTTVGDKLEVIEAIKMLKGEWTEDLREIVMGIGTQALLMSKKVKTAKEAESLLLHAVESGKAFACFKKFIEDFGGDFDAVYLHPEPKSKYRIEMKAWKDGYIKIKDAKAIGNIVNKEITVVGKKIDYEAGIRIAKKMPDHVKKGDLILTIFTDREEHDQIVGQLKKTMDIQATKPKMPKSEVLKIIKGY